MTKSEDFESFLKNINPSKSTTRTRLSRIRMEGKCSWQRDTRVEWENHPLSTEKIVDKYRVGLSAAITQLKAALRKESSTANRQKIVNMVNF